MTAASGQDAVANGRRHSSYPPGYCQKYVRLECWEVGSLYASAIEAWDGAREKHKGDRTPPVGAPCYYSGGQYGHAVIFTGGDDIRSTDCQTTGKVSEDTISWPERAWGYKYLGWTGDINGVDLPLSSGGSNPDHEEDDMPNYDHAARGSDRTLPAGEWIGIEWETVTGDGAFTPGSPSCKVGGRTYSAVLHATVEAPNGGSIRLRTVEVDDGDVAESNPVTEVLATAGGTYCLHAQIGACKSGRVLRFRVSADNGGTLTAADATVLSW